MFLVKGVLKICSKFTGVLPCNFIEIKLRHRYSLVNLLHFFGTLFTKNTSGSPQVIDLNQSTWKLVIHSNKGSRDKLNWAYSETVLKYTTLFFWAIKGLGCKYKVFSIDLFVVSGKCFICQEAVKLPISKTNHFSWCFWWYFWWFFGDINAPWTHFGKQLTQLKTTQNDPCIMPFPQAVLLVMCKNFVKLVKR